MEDQDHFSSALLDEEGQALEQGFVDAEDAEILMHRDCHFGGNFSLMLAHYEDEGWGFDADLSIDRIRQLAQLEKQSRENLGAVLLSGIQAEQVGEVLQTYAKLRAIVESQKTKGEPSRLIAELILADREDPQEEMEAIVRQGGKMIPLLVDLLLSEQFLNPLFPAYGHAPRWAARCLGRLGNEAAIPGLFAALSTGDFSLDEEIFGAFRGIGEAAKKFLRTALSGNIFNRDSQRAVEALISIAGDEELTGQLCLSALEKAIAAKAAPELLLQLLWGCESLQNEGQIQALLQLIGSSSFPVSLKMDGELLAVKLQRKLKPQKAS